MNPVAVGFNVLVLPLITTCVPSGEREIGTPATVINIPGVKISPFGSVMVLEATGVKGILLVPSAITKPPVAGRDSNFPSIMVAEPGLSVSPFGSLIPSSEGKLKKLSGNCVIGIDSGRLSTASGVLSGELKLGVPDKG